MDLKTVIVDLDSVQAKPADETAPELEALANTIIQLRGLVSLPVVRQLAIDQYELISGELEFQAYIQAQKMDDSLPDRIMAFLANSETEQSIRQQQKILSTITGKSTASVAANSSSLLDVSNLSAQIDRLSKSQDGSFAALQSIVIAAIQDTISQPLPMLVAFNRIQEPAVVVQISKNLAFLGDKKVQKMVKLLQASRRKGKEFQSFAEVMAVLVETRNQKQFKVVSDKKLLEMIDRWG
jgi:hypothetical protein